LFVKDQIVENTRVKDALKHQYIPDNFAAQKRVLHFRIFNKVVQPLFSELRHPTHFKEVRGL
jgi:hypothetical protein